MEIDDSDRATLVKNLTPKFFPKKSTVALFLKLIYSNISKRSHGNFNSYTFQELNLIPLFCSDKIFHFICDLSTITQSQFIDGLIFLLFGNFNKKIIATFQIFDFDDDDIVYKDDVFLMLAHFHLIMNSNETINELEDIINGFFQDSETITRDDYLKKIQNENCDIPLLLIIFINNYLLFFEESELKFLEKVNGLKDKDKKKTEIKEDGFNDLCSLIRNTTNINNFINDMKEISNDYSFLEPALQNNSYKASQKLYKYVTSSLLPRNEFVDETENNSDCSSDEEELKDLVDFETDVSNAFTTLQDLNVYFNKKQFTKNKTMKVKLKNTKILNDSEDEDNDNNNNNENAASKKNDKNMGSSFFDDDNHSAMKTNSNTTNENSMKGNQAGKKGKKNMAYNKSVTEMRFNRHQPQTKENEIYLYKNENNMKNKTNPVKLVLINKYLFYFKNPLTFKKIIPLASLFPRKTSSSTFPQLTLISTVHNYIKQYCYFCDNQNSLDSFYQLLCDKADYRIIQNEIELKKELGKGKFGNVLLGIDKTYEGANKFFAVKTVNKNNPTEEEYKINRWESTIFNSLKNVNHPNIVKCFKKYENEKNIYFVYEFVKGSDLKVFSRMDKSPQMIKHTLLIAFQILKGLKELHKYGIIHRDIKTTNILISCDGPEVDNSVKIIDFGLSRVLGFHEYSIDPYGSLCFKAPELIRHLPYSFKVDIWAVGVTVYYLMFRELPFEKGSKQNIKNSIVNSNVHFPIDEELFEETIENSIMSSEMVEEVKKNNSYSLQTNMIYKLISDCLEKTVKNRPNTTQLIAKYIRRMEE